METDNQIRLFIDGQPESKKKDLTVLHELILKIIPNAKLWLLDGKNDQGKVVSNPNIGYGSVLMNYADGSKREFYKIEISPNSTGISIYVMGLKDKNFLIKQFGDLLGKAKITGYCIKFRNLDEININVLEKGLKGCL